MDKNLYKIWHQVPVDYYQQGVKKNLFQKFWHGEKIITAKKIIKTLKFSKCLDVGCASGYMLSEIAKAFPKSKYFGIDVYDRAISYAKKTYPKIEFKVAASEKIPYKNESFDLIICYETIEHVENPLKTLQEARRVLKKDGNFILAMDSGNLLFRTVWFIWENTTGKVWQGAHLNPFHHDELENLIKKSGFKIKQKLFSHFGMEVVFVLSRK